MSPAGIKIQFTRFNLLSRSARDDRKARESQGRNFIISYLNKTSYFFALFAQRQKYCDVIEAGKLKTRRKKIKGEHNCALGLLVIKNIGQQLQCGEDGSRCDL